LEHSHRILHNTSSSTDSQAFLPKGRIELDLSFNPLSPSYYKELIPWTLFACRYVPRSLLIDYIPHILSSICRYIQDDVSRTKLIAEATVLLLINVDTDGSIAHPEVLYHTLNHPAIVSLLNLDVTDSTLIPTHCFRERFIASLCRGIIKLLPITIGYVLATKFTKEGESSVISLSTTATSYDQKKKRFPYNGMGCYAELCGSTLRTMSNYQQVVDSVDGLHLTKSALTPSCASSMDAALQQLDNIIASSLFVLRSAHKYLTFAIFPHVS
jgi:hypothetical protein